MVATSVRAVFFDFGGTLVEPLRDAYPTYRAVLRPFGIALARGPWTEANDRALLRTEPLRYASVGRNPSWSERVSAETLRGLGVPDRRGRIVAALQEAFTSPMWHRPFPESEAVLRELQDARTPVHLVSNNVDDLLVLLQRLGWDGWFSSVTYSQEVGAEKPDPRVFALALARAGCRPGDVVHVGDSWEKDYHGANRAGLRGVWLNRDGGTPPGACESVRDLWGVLPLLGADRPGDRPAPRGARRSRTGAGTEPADERFVRPSSSDGGRGKPPGRPTPPGRKP